MLNRTIILAIVIALAAVATAKAGFEYTWGTANGGECAWGDASSCASTGSAPTPPAPSSSCTFNETVFGTADCTF